MAVTDIVFDLGGVLVDWNPRYLFDRHLGGEQQEVEHFLEHVCSPEWHARLDGGASFAAACTPLARAEPRFAAWIAAYDSHWEHMFAGEFADTVALLRRIHRLGLPVHALSNYPAQQIRFLYRRFDFMRLFDTVVISGLLGTCKPDLAIYERVLAGRAAETFLFIDDRAENVAAAAALGMQTVKFDQEGGVRRLSRVVEQLEQFGIS